MLRKLTLVAPVAQAAALAACSGSGDPAAASCYEGAAGALGVKETVKVNLKKYASGAGSMDLAGTGIMGFTCADHSFTKSGQDVTVDLSDCLPSGVTVPKVQYCSESDTIAVTVKDKAVPIPITATLKRVSCAASNEVDFATCSGSSDPPASSACYEGKAGALGLTEDVKVDVKGYGSGKGTMDLTGSGIEAFTCKDHSFTKSGQEISVDVSDCVPKGIVVSEVKYCSDSDQLKVTVKDKAVPLPISALLSKVTCASSAVSEQAGCSGSGEPAAATCYEGAAGALGVKETVKVNLKKYASGAGSLDLAGTGIMGFTCADHSFTKSGQDVTVDLSDCLPSGVTVPKVQYCSESDTIAVTVKDKAVPIPITATLKKVSCAASNDVDFATCSGSSDPPASSACYEGKAGALGLTEDVKVDVKGYASGKGTMDLTGSGIEAFTCKDHSFTKSGQEISVDVSDCVPKGIVVSDVKYCSDSDQLKVTVKDKAVPLPISALLSKVTCASSAVSEQAGCSGSGEPAAATCYEGAAGALGVKETVKVNLKKYASGAGSLDLAGTGIMGFTCADHSFTKSGQDVTVDLSDCLPSGVTVPKVQYCSESDTIAVTVKDKAVPIPITATLKKVSCAASNEIDFATCSGSSDPPASSACYEGKAGALGLTEDVKVDVKGYASGQGTMDLTGSGIEAFTCKDHAFTKSGQEISVDVSDCVPKGIVVSDVKYCSDSDQLKVTVKDKAVPLPISAMLSKVACASNTVVV